MNNFSIHHQITRKEYIRLNFALLYGKMWFMTLSGMSAIYIMWSVLLWCMGRYSILDNQYYGIGLAIAFVPMYIPALTWFKCLRIYKVNFKLSEPFTYDFSEEGLVITGESFNSKYTWEKIPRIKTIKGWLLVYQGRAITNLVKTEPADNANFESLKVFLKDRYPQIKVK